MMARMGGRRVEAHSSADPGVEAIIKSGVRGTPDVAALASLAPGRLAVLVWHYHDDDVPGPGAAIELEVTGLPAAAAHPRPAHYRIDESHSNVYALWQKLGAPTAPTRGQYQQLEAASQRARLEEPPANVPAADGATRLRFTLPRQAVSLLVFQWRADSE